MTNFFENIPKSILSIIALIVAVIAMHYKVEFAPWAIAAACALYYAECQTVPFMVLMVALGGMAWGLPIAPLMVFSFLTMVKWGDHF